jgi:hypothetical protein
VNLALFMSRFDSERVDGVGVGGFVIVAISL